MLKQAVQAQSPARARSAFQPHRLSSSASTFLPCNPRCKTPRNPLNLHHSRSSSSRIVDTRITWTGQKFACLFLRSAIQSNKMHCKNTYINEPLTCILCTKEVGIIKSSHGKCQRIVSTSQHNHRLFTIHSLFLRQSIKHSLIHQSTTHLPTLSPTHSLTRSLTTIQSPDFIASPTLSLLPACMHTYIITHPNKSRCLIPT